jgi:hypothetical protein
MVRLRSEKPQSNRSVEEILTSAYEDSLRQAYDLLRAWADLPSDSRPSIQMLMEQNPVFSRTIELEGWVFPDRDEPKQRELRANRMTEMFDKAKAPFEVTDTVRKVILRHGKGARIKPEMRRLVKKALESKWNEPKVSLMRFTLDNCTCSKRSHDLLCKERIRQGVMELEKLIKPR